MNFLTFRQTFEAFPVIAAEEITRYFPEFDRNNLTRWQNKGYIQKLRNSFYRLNKPLQHQEELFLIAGKLYSPSYVSLESALSWHGLIPEGVFTVTSVSNLKTRHFDTAIGRFEYRNLKKDLLFGCQLSTSGDFQFKIADPVKALLDFLYLRPDVHEPGHLEELRLDLSALKCFFEQYPVEQYLKQFNSATLTKKISFIQNRLP